MRDIHVHVKKAQTRSNLKVATIIIIDNYFNKIKFVLRSSH